MTYLVASFLLISITKLITKKHKKLSFLKATKNQKFKNKLMFLKIIFKNMSHKKTKNIYKKFVFIKKHFHLNV